VEQVALLAQQNTLPEPTLDLSLLSYSPAPTQNLAAAYTNSHTNASAIVTQSGASSSGAGSAGASVLPSASASVAPPPPDDPWMTGAARGAPFGAPGINGDGVPPPPSSVAGTGLPSGWWKKLERVTVQFAGQQGFVLNRYMVYGITIEVRRRLRWELLLLGLGD
jgi:sorting nexin-8